MSILKREEIRARPITQSMAFVDNNEFDNLCDHGYISLDRCPEVVMAVRAYADIISSMTITLMSNTKGGDVRIRNELSRMVDITPYRNSTRKTWMDFIVMTLMLYGSGNAVVFPKTSQGRLTDLEPIPASQVSFQANGNDYKIRIDGKTYDPNDLLHFVFNPAKNQPWRGEGLNVQLRDVANNLKQAAATEKGFMSSKWKPSLIVKVDALTDEFSSPEGRQKLVNQYITTNQAGEPWLIPADQFSVEQIKPLSLSDLAINEVVTLDKKTVAAIVGVPNYILGVGEFNAAAHNNFINNKVRPICREIEQELTRKLLISPQMYWRFNTASSYSYDIKLLESVYSDAYVKGLVTGNEVRDKLGMEPRDGLDELVILENYIPLDKIGDQLKLKQEE